MILDEYLPLLGNESVNCACAVSNSILHIQDENSLKPALLAYSKFIFNIVLSNKYYKIELIALFNIYKLFLQTILSLNDIIKIHRCIIHNALFLLWNNISNMRNSLLADIDVCIVGTLEQFRFWIHRMCGERKSIICSLLVIEFPLM